MNLYSTTLFGSWAWMAKVPVESFFSPAILRLPPVDDNGCRAGLDVPSSRECTLDPVSVDVGEHVVVHNAVKRAVLMLSTWVALTWHS